MKKVKSSINFELLLSRYQIELETSMKVSNLSFIAFIRCITNKYESWWIRLNEKQKSSKKSYQQ